MKRITQGSSATHSQVTAATSQYSDGEEGEKQVLQLLLFLSVVKVIGPVTASSLHILF
jgi:hypothetical protein